MCSGNSDSSVTRSPEALTSAWVEAQMRFPAPSEATPNAFNRGNVVERLIGTRVILDSGFSRNVVQGQRRQLEALRALAVKYQFALVIIHHSPKRAPKKAQGSSVFDAMLGTTGIGTVVDVGVVLEDTGRAGEVLARFSGRNPDTPTELALKLDRVGRTGWKVMSVGDQAREGTGMGRVARAILEVLENAGTSMTPLEIADEHKGEPTLNPSSVRVNCRRMVKKGYLTEHDGGRYGIPETPVTSVTASASDCGAASSESYSYRD